MCELRHGPSLIRWSNSSTSDTAKPPPRVSPPPHQPQHKMKKIVQEIRKESTKNKICIQAPNNSRSNKIWIMILLISRVSWNEQRLVMLSQVWDFQVYLLAIISPIWVPSCFDRLLYCQSMTSGWQRCPSGDLVVSMGWRWWVSPKKDKKFI